MRRHEKKCLHAEILSTNEAYSKVRTNPTPTNQNNDPTNGKNKRIKPLQITSSHTEKPLLHQRTTGLTTAQFTTLLTALTHQLT